MPPQYPQSNTLLGDSGHEGEAVSPPDQGLALMMNILLPVDGAEIYSRMHESMHASSNSDLELLVVGDGR